MNYRKSKIMDGIVFFQCTKCKTWGERDMFYRDQHQDTGITSKCKACLKNYTKKYYNSKLKPLADVRSEKKKNERYEIINGIEYQKCTSCGKWKQITRFHKKKESYYGHSLRCKNCVKKYSHAWYGKNKATALSNSKEWAKNNREKVAAIQKKWEVNNPQRYRDMRNKTQRKLYHKKKHDIKYYKWKVSRNFASQMRNALKGNKDGRHWETLVNYNLDSLIRRLKATMPKGYTWEDYLNGTLHIDHIIPISVFNYETSAHFDFKKCWDLKNLRLLPAHENISKRDKLENPFQPCLLLGF